MSAVRVVDRGANELIARLRALRTSKARVRVGVLSDAPKQEREGGAGRYSLLEVAIVHEFGAPAANIPARSFLRGTVDARRADIEALQATLLAQVVEGKIELRPALDLMGAKVASWIQNRIVEGIEPPLKAETIRRKKSSTPLVDTGQLKSSISWAVEG